MDDRVIIELYFKRAESAIAETRNKYGRMLKSIALGILRNMEDAQECESDTYLKTWETIPPVRPDVFSAFLSKITRNLSLDRYEYIHAKKRGSGEIPALLDELAECIPSQGSEYADEMALREILDVFLSGLKKDARVIFMRRYWFGDSVAEIAEGYGCSTSKVKMSLMRARKNLKALLEKEGYMI